MMNLKTLIYEKTDGVARVTLNRPEVLNAINSIMRRELLQVISDFSNDNEVRVATIMGAGRAFSSGTDLSDLNESSGFPPSEAILFREVMRSMEKSPKVVIAAINGTALGGALEFALGCDFRIADERAELGFPEVRLGLIPGAGGTQRLPRIVGVSKAKELIFKGKRVKAEEAQRIGLVDAVAPKDKFDGLVNEWINDIKMGAPVSVASSKFSINSVYEGIRLEEGLTLEGEFANLNFETLDKQEGLRALNERRKPKFSGF
jgi:enoyl-CoA hydratase/carnithine racemase